MNEPLGHQIRERADPRSASPAASRRAAARTLRGRLLSFYSSNLQRRPLHGVRTHLPHSTNRVDGGSGPGKARPCCVGTAPAPRWTPSRQSRLLHPGPRPCHAPLWSPPLSTRGCPHPGLSRCPRFRAALLARPQLRPSAAPPPPSQPSHGPGALRGHRGSPGLPSVPTPSPYGPAGLCPPARAPTLAPAAHFLSTANPFPLVCSTWVFLIF